MKKKKKVSIFWIIVIALLIGVAVLWFYLNISSVDSSTKLMKEATRVSKPLKNNFNITALENIQKRSKISEDLLGDIKSYKDTSEQNK